MAWGGWVSVSTLVRRLLLLIGVCLYGIHILLLCSMPQLSQRSLRTLCRTARSILSQRLLQEREGAALPPQQWD